MLLFLRYARANWYLMSGDVWIGLIESLQNFDRFFRVALCQQHIALQSAAIDVFRRRG